jgi:hypothetical protein
MEENTLEIEVYDGVKDVSFIENIDLDKIEHLLIILHKSISIKFLNKFKNLKELVLGGSIKDYAPVSNCLSLERLCISSRGKIDNLDFIKQLYIKELSLEGIRPGVDNLIIPNVKTIEDISISNVSKMTDLDFLSDFTQLKTLSLFEFKAKKLFDFSKMKNLTKLSIINMFHLINFEELKTIKNLDKLYLKYFYINRKTKIDIVIDEITKMIKEIKHIKEIIIDDNGKIYDKEMLLKII